MDSRGYVFFFFFQAEDGIRDLTVTGVQTCALPISSLTIRLSKYLPDALVRCYDSPMAQHSDRRGGSAPSARRVAERVLEITLLVTRLVEIGRASCRERV